MNEDPYYEGLFKICSIYRQNKETVRSMLGVFQSPETILTTMYSYLVERKEVDPIDDTDSLTRARYILEVF